MSKRVMRRIVVMITILTMLVYIPSVSVYAAGETKGKTIDQMVQGMTTRQKIAQCLMVDFRKWDNADGEAEGMTKLSSDVADILTEYQFGAVILFAENIQETKDTVRLTKDMQAAAMKKGGLPLLITTDQEGGIVYRLGSGTALPGNMALGATGDSDNARTTGEIIGRELDAVGINTTLAPVIDVNNNANNPVIGVRSFSDDADIVGKFGTRYISGLNEYNVIGCAKHFPGHGDTETDSHTGLPEVDKSKEALEKSELKPYRIVIDKGIDMIMSAHILYPQLDNTTILSNKTGKEERRPATLSHKILTDMLRGEMKFNGVVVTDAMNMSGISDRFDMGQATLESLKAGADLICMPVTGITNKADWKAAMEDVISTVEKGVDDKKLTEASLDESVTRILKLKQKKGILDYDASNYTEKKALATVGSKENRDLEREMAARAVTVIRNKSKVLPCDLDGDDRVLMMAPYENEMAQMVMGLNRAKAAGLVPEETKVDVYNYSAEDYEVKGELKEAMDWADVIIVNSEVAGAAKMDYNDWTSAGPKNLTEYASKKGKKSFVMSVSKPYDVQLYPKANAVLAVYGFKGSQCRLSGPLFDGEVVDDKMAFGPNIVAGVEVIFGVFGATGKLPVNVPVYNKSSKSFTKEVKYKRGYGLTYKALEPPAPDIDLSLGKLTISESSLVYTGKSRKPGVVVRDENGKRVSKTVYTVKYSNNKMVGKAKVVVTGKGKYTGTLKGSFRIVPANAAIKSLKAGKRSLQVKFTSKPSKLGASKYQIAYKVKSAGSWKYKTTSKDKIKIKKLKKSKKYQVKVRAYKKISGETYYGKWSKVMTGRKIK